VVYRFLRTDQGVTDREGIQVVFVLFTLLYIVISVGLITALLRWPRGESEAEEASEAPTTPREAHDVA
jgi:cytochrome bd-type quinol oxidase subunit 1